MKILTILMLITTIGTHGVIAQVPPQGDIWRAFAQKIDVGTRVKVRLIDGQRVTATLIQVNADELLVQPRTRIPVPLQRIIYDEIASLERDDARGMGAGKAVAVAVASGVAAILGLLFVVALMQS